MTQTVTTIELFCLYSALCGTLWSSGLMHFIVTFDYSYIVVINGLFHRVKKKRLDDLHLFLVWNIFYIFVILLWNPLSGLASPTNYNYIYVGAVENFSCSYKFLCTSSIAIFQAKLVKPLFTSTISFSNHNNNNSRSVRTQLLSITKTHILFAYPQQTFLTNYESYKPPFYFLAPQDLNKSIVVCSYHISPNLRQLPLDEAC